MVFPTNLDSVAFRFSSYIKELHDFFNTQGVKFGQPTDLAGFADRLDNSASFHDDMGSLLRSIVYGEAENITPVEVFELLVLAVAGQKIEDASQEFHEPVARLFGFVTRSLRIRRELVPSEKSPAPEPEHIDRERMPDNPLPHAAELWRAGGPPEAAARPETDSPRSRTASHDSHLAVGTPLFGTYGSAAERDESDTEAHSGSRRGTAIFKLVAGVLVIAGVTVYFAKPALFGVHQGSTEQRLGRTAETAAAPSKTVADCVGSSQFRTQPGALSEDYQHVLDLKARNRFDAALAGLRDIAAADPGYPGINLDISDLALQMRHTQQARDAVSAQIAISECFAGLSPPMLESYCKTEFPLDATDTCHSRLAQIKAAAQLQAGAVTQQLSNNIGSVSPPRKDRPAHATRSFSQTGDSASYPRAPARRPARDRSLVEGEGTDSAFGAYSKP